MKFNSSPKSEQKLMKMVQTWPGRGNLSSHHGL